MNSELVVKELKNIASPKKAKASSWFFKTGKGEYGEGDIFYGVTVPEQRQIAKKYKNLPIDEIQKLLNDKVHECRLTGLFILVNQYEKGGNKKLEKKREEVAKFYLKNSKKVNNWDLVDSSASYILGDYLLDKKREILYKLAKSKNLWERRIAIISTAKFISKNQFEDTLKISKILLKDSHDLIHKAVGWMLREVGKKSEKTLVSFLNKYAKVMPRTALRYAIERFPEKKRKYYLNKK